MKVSRILIMLFLGYAAVWTALLLVPDIARILFMPSDLSDQLQQSSLPIDKLVHLAGYFGFMMLAALAFGRQPWAVPLHWIFVGSSAHAAATEIAQIFIPQRRGDLIDWLVDVAGVLAATGVIVLIRTPPSSAKPSVHSPERPH